MVKSRNVESWEYSKAERKKFEGECEDKAREFLELNGIDYNPVNLYIAKHCFLLIETGSKDKMKALDRLYRWAEASGNNEVEDLPEGTVEKIFSDLKNSGMTEKQMRAQVRKVYKED